MTLSERDLVKRVRDGPVNYALLKLIHHEVGNDIAVLSGYRQLLQRALLMQEQEASPPMNEQLLAYLRTMQEREIRLNNLLFQLRELSPGARDEPLCQNFVQIDLVVLLRRVIEQRVPLCPDHILQTSMPAQPLFIRCDPFWMEVLLEHIINYIIVGHTDPIPAEIYLERFPNHMGREAKMTLRLRKDLPKLPSGREGEFAVQLRALYKDETEVCLAMCHEILHEHGGRIWNEQEGMISLALPLAA